MSHRYAGGGLFVFVALTLALFVNLTGLQSGTRELAPAPAMIVAGLAVANGGKSPDGELVILNSSSPQPSRTAMEVQRELTAFGYQPGPVNGTAGLMTRAAIMAFEYDNGLPLTAAADDVQLQRLLLGTGRVAPSSMENAGLPVSDEAKLVMQTIQQSLKQMGYEPGPVNGAYSAETERAIRNLETDHNLPETGRVSGRLVEALAALANRGQIKVTRR
ncbi:MAG: peptidoglycan-binding protein [Alphaproteobacteria bacterium]|nr:peptidoglycan-binding protein [Alphaproteobacteria bacterium]